MAPPQSGDEIQVLEEWPLPYAPQSTINIGAHKESRVAIEKSEGGQLRVQPSHESGRAPASFEAQGANSRHRALFHGIKDHLQGLGFRAAICVEEPEDRCSSATGTGRELRASSLLLHNNLERS